MSTRWVPVLILGKHESRGFSRISRSCAIRIGTGRAQSAVVARERRAKREHPLLVSAAETYGAGRKIESLVGASAAVVVAVVARHCLGSRPTGPAGRRRLLRAKRTVLVRVRRGVGRSYATGITAQRNYLGG